MSSSPRATPRLPLLLPLLPLLAALTGCSSGSNVDGDLKGRIGGRDVDLHLRLDSDGSGVDDGTLGDDEPNRDIAPGFVILGGVPAATSVSGSKCVVDPCPPLAEIDFYSPPPLVYAGTWKATEAELKFTDEDFYGKADISFHGRDDHFELTFKEPDFSSSGNVTMVNTGTVDAAHVVNGETLAFKGNFRLEYQCHKQSRYYRHCGNTKGGGPNPIKRPYTENTCPAELVTPYEGAPSWSGNTLTLGGFKIDCREGGVTDSSTGSLPLLCYQRRTKVSAGGCTWTVHFLTDGSIQQFAIAGFADGACAQKTCNTYR